VSIAGELREGEYCENDAAKFKCHELAVVHDLRPAKRAVEVPERGEIAGTKSDQIGQGCGCVHGAEYDAEPGRVSHNRGIFGSRSISSASCSSGY